MTIFRWLSAIPLVLVWLAGAALAQALPQPTGPVVLTVSGPLGQTNADGTARFDMAMLEALPQRETRTTTPWHEGLQTFSGPRLSDLMAALGATGSELRVVALNDYAASVPWSDLETYPVILATRHNGNPMPVRQHGPLFVIYPFDEHPEIRTEVHFGRSVWQIDRIEVVP